MPPLSLNYAPRSLHCVLNIILSLEINDVVYNFMANNHAPLSLNYAPRFLHCVLNIILSLEINDNVVYFYG